MTDKQLTKIIGNIENKYSYELFCKYYNKLSLAEIELLQRYINELKNEQWKDVIIHNKQFPYKVSNCGNVIDNDGKNIIPPTNSTYCDRRRYKLVTIRDHINKISIRIGVHRLVAEAFIPNPENKPQVNHIHGIKTYNCAWDLEWNTCSENVKHAYRTGLNTNYGENNYNAKLKSSDVIEICKMMKTGMHSIMSIANKFQVNRQTLLEIYHGRTWVSISKHYVPFPPFPGVKGEHSNLSKLSEYDVIEICKYVNSIYESNNKITTNTIDYLSNKFNVSICCIRNILIGLTWKEVTSKYITEYYKPNQHTNEIFYKLDYVRQMILNGLSCKCILDKLNIEYNIRNINYIHKIKSVMKKNREL